MPEPALLTPTKRPATATRMYAVVMAVGITCAIAIVAVYESTKPVIARNQAAARQQAILDVLPDAVTTATFRLDDEGRFVRVPEQADIPELLFAGYDNHNRLCGLAIEAHGMGYQDTVRVLYGYSFGKQAVIGLRVLESRETPGLGDRVETDAAFVKNFDALDLRLTADGVALAHEVEFVKPGEKQSAWQIDGISGATITSRAIADMLRESTKRWIPVVNERRDDFDANSENQPVGASPRFRRRPASGGSVLLPTKPGASAHRLICCRGAIGGVDEP